ncbi:MAG: hypothetical protein O3B65_00695 [Chloroflexi bacterium]|nr:hypothetical protein [Chloroflexota bacterium]
MSHGEFLRQHSEDPQLASHVMHDYRNADWDPQTRAMLDYASKLTKEPESVRQADFEHLKEVGLTEDQILSTVLITCTFAFMTRLADGLGVEPAEGRQEWVESWLMGPARDQEWLLQPKK